MTKLQRILSALLAIQVVLSVALFWPRTTDNAESGPLFDDLNIDNVEAITLESGDGTLTRLLHQGENWILADSGEYPVDSEKVEPLLAKIAAIQTNRLVARSSSSHQRLQVANDDFAQRIQLEMNDGATNTLLVGSAPNPSGTHVRRENQSETYLTGDLAAWEINPAVANWIDTTYTSLDRAEIASILLENANGVFEFEKDSQGEWTLKGLAEGEEFDPSQFNALLSRITNMRLTTPLGTAPETAYGLEDPQAKITVITESSEALSEHTLQIGAQDSEDDTFIVKWSDSDYYVKVSAFNVENMVNPTRNEFVKEIPPAGSEEVIPEEESIAPTPEA